MNLLDLLILLFGLTALGIGLPRASTWMRRPRLHLYADRSGPGDRVRIGDRPASRFFVRVENGGLSPARACRGMLDTLEYWDGEGWRPHPGFPYSIELPWARRSLPNTVDLYPSDSADLVVGATVEGESRFRLLPPVAISSGILLEYPPGTYRLGISVTTGAGVLARIARRFVVEHDGGWDGVRIRAEGPERAAFELASA